MVSFCTHWKHVSLGLEQKQPPEVFYIKRCFEKFRNVFRKTPVQESLYNKVAGRPATLLKKRSLHDCFPVNFAKFLRTLFVQNTFKQLLLLERDLVWNDLISLWVITQAKSLKSVSLWKHQLQHSAIFEVDVPHYQRIRKNPVKYIWWSFSAKIISQKKSSIDVWQGSKYTCDYIFSFFLSNPALISPSKRLLKAESMFFQ